MINVMLDLETLGTAPGCTILSIGAVALGPNPVLSLYVPAISRATCAQAGLKEDDDTLSWWYRQEDYTLLERANAPDAIALGNALHGFAIYLANLCDPKEVRVWGNGADFDLPILAEAYRRCGMRVPWAPYAGRCYRTLKNLRPDIKLVRVGAYHNAIDDALSQAEHATRLLDAL